MDLVYENWATLFGQPKVEIQAPGHGCNVFRGPSLRYAPFGMTRAAYRKTSTHRVTPKVHRSNVPYVRPTVAVV